MTIEEIKNLIEPFIDEPTIHFIIEKQIFSEDSGRKIFNKKIRQNVEKRFGVYIWLDTATNEIVYIGMAGKVKTDGTFSNHSLQKRLLASRGRDKLTKKDIQTNDYVKKFMKDNNINSLDFYFLYSKEDIPPAYIEAILLYEFFKEKKCLPRLNNSF